MIQLRYKHLNIKKEIFHERLLQISVIKISHELSTQEGRVSTISLPQVGNQLEESIKKEKNFSDLIQIIQKLSRI
jgi:hypothetical protein